MMQVTLNLNSAFKKENPIVGVYKRKKKKKIKTKKKKKRSHQSDSENLLNDVSRFSNVTVSDCKLKLMS